MPGEIARRNAMCSQTPCHRHLHDHPHIHIRVPTVCYGIVQVLLSYLDKVNLAIEWGQNNPTITATSHCLTSFSSRQLQRTCRRCCMEQSVVIYKQKEDPRNLLWYMLPLCCPWQPSRRGSSSVQKLLLSFLALYSQTQPVNAFVLSWNPLRISAAFISAPLSSVYTKKRHAFCFQDVLSLSLSLSLSLCSGAAGTITMYLKLLLYRMAWIPYLGQL